MLRFTLSDPVKRLCLCAAHSMINSLQAKEEGELPDLAPFLSGLDLCEAWVRQHPETGQAEPESASGLRVVVLDTTAASPGSAARQVAFQDPSDKPLEPSGDRAPRVLVILQPFMHMVLAPEG